MINFYYELYTYQIVCGIKIVSIPNIKKIHEFIKSDMKSKFNIKPFLDLKDCWISILNKYHIIDIIINGMYKVHGGFNEEKAKPKMTHSIKQK